MSDSRSTTVFVTLGSHLDLFWMGTHEECLARGTELARMALDFMEQDSEYCYYIETTVFAEYHLRKYPEDKPRMERFLREGRLEIGACYVDRVEHIHDGESLIRHAVLGVRWLRETFGIQPRTVSHPDLPGMSPQVPQIYARAGIRAYLRARGFGFTFNWEAPDGSQILYANLWGYGRKKLEDFERPLAEPGRPERFLVRGGYSDLEPPSLDVLDVLKRLREAHPGVGFRLASLGQVLDQFPLDALPSVRGEMPFGWGSIPSAFVRLLQLSVELEHLLLATERWSAVARGLGLALAPAELGAELTARSWWTGHRQRGTVIHHDPIPPGRELTELWRYELFTQDHNYAGRHGAQSEFDKTVMKEHALFETRRWLDGALAAISSQVQVPAGEPVVLFNPLSWPRNEIIHVAHSAPDTVEVLDSDGNLVDCQTAPGGLAVPVLVPSLGYRAYAIADRKRRPSHDSDDEELDPACGEDLGRTTVLQGQALTPRLDWDGGWLRGLYDHRLGQELTEPDGERGLGELVSYEDPAVDVRYNFTGKVSSDRDVRYQMMDASLGPLLHSITLEGMFLGCRVEKEFVAYRSQPRLDINVRLYWWGKQGEHVRLCFPFRRAGFVGTWYGVPFAAMRWPEMLSGTADEEILRQGGAGTDMLAADDRLHFREALGWLDVAYAGWGITLATRSPTFWIGDSLLQAVLLRTQHSCGDSNLWNVNPGRFDWSFRIQPHAGDWRQAHAYRAGQELLTPLTAARPAPHAGGALPSVHSFVTIEPDHVMLTALKPSDLIEGAFIVRVLEMAGTPTEALIRIAGPVDRAFDVNLLEDRGPELPVEGGVIRVKLNPYEFRTVQVHGRLLSGERAE